MLARVDEAGISGTTNWSGDPLAESNMALVHSQAFGSAGSRSWGEWERIRRTDPDIAAVLEFISAPIRDARVDVEPAEHPSLAPELAQAQADFVKRQLDACAPRLPEVLSQMTQGPLTFGFSLHEVVLGVVDDAALPGGRGYGLKKLAERLPVSVHPVNGWRETVLPDGSVELDAIQQIGQQGRTFRSDIMLPADRVLLTTWQRTGNNYRGFSAFRPVWYLAKIREQLSKLIAVSLMREGAGIPTLVAIGNDSPDLNDDTRAKLEVVLGNLVFHENANLVLPKGWKLDWIFSGGANKGHLIEVYSALGKLILRQLGAQQIALGSDAGSGSRAVGQTHSEVSSGYVQAVVANIESVLNGVGSRPYTGLARKLVVPNWGPQPAYPRIVLTLKKSSLGPLEKMQAVEIATRAGAVKLTRDDENGIREELGLAPVAIEQAVDQQSASLNGAQAQSAVAIVQAVASGTLPRDSGLGMLAAFFGMTPEEATAVMGTAGATPPAAPVAPQAGLTPSPVSPQVPAGLARLAAPRGPWAPWRALRPAEQRVDFARIDQTLTDARADFERAMKPVVAELLMKAAPDVAKAMADGDASDVHAVPLDVSRVASTVSTFVDGLVAKGNADVRKELRKDSGAQVAEERRHQFDQKDDPLATPDEDAERQALLDAQKAALVRRIEARLTSQLEREAIDVTRTGGDAADVVREVLGDQFDTGAFRADAGLVTTKVYNIGRDEAAQAMGGVATVEYSALLDGQTCSACMAMDGKQADFNSSEHDAMLPPNRDCDGQDNCRCVLVFIPGGDS